MTDSQWQQMDQRVSDMDRDLRSRLESFDKHIVQMTSAMSDIRDALLGDIKNTEVLGLIASHRQLKNDFSTYKAELAKWRAEAAEPAIKDVTKFKIQVGVVSSIIVLVWTIIVKLIWK